MDTSETSRQRHGGLLSAGLCCINLHRTERQKHREQHRRALQGTEEQLRHPLKRVSVFQNSRLNRIKGEYLRSRSSKPERREAR